MSWISLLWGIADPLMLSLMFLLIRSIEAPVVPPATPLLPTTLMTLFLGEPTTMLGICVAAAAALWLAMMFLIIPVTSPIDWVF